MTPEPDRLRGYIVSRLEDAARRAGLDVIPENQSLFELGLLDSMGFLELVAAVEAEFGLEVDFDAYDPAEFTTLAGLTAACAAAAGA